MELLTDSMRDLLTNNSDIQKMLDLDKLSKQPGFAFEQTNQYIYIGQMIEGEKHGTGILKILESQRIYVGEWHQNKKHGLAYERFQSGAEYFGNYSNNKQHGYGEYVWANGEVYKGNWVEGKKSGYGEWEGSNTSYKGEWNNGFVEGKGVYQSENGDKYIGDFIQSMKHGLGEEHFSNGDKYIGGFKTGKPEGYGEYYWKNGSFYQGFFLNGMRHGHGVWQSNSVGKFDRYEGAYVNDRKCGYGEFSWSNGALYKGNYFDDCRQGYGEMYQNNIAIYQGEWDRGMQADRIGLGKQKNKQQIIQGTQNKWRCEQIDEIAELEEITSSEAEMKKGGNEQKQRMKTLNMEVKNYQLDMSPQKKSMQLRKKTLPTTQPRSRTLSNGNCKVPIIQQKQRSNSNQIDNNQKIEQLIKFSPYKQMIRGGYKFKLQKLTK